MGLSYKNIATIINEQIMKNATGENEGIIIAEDLSNLVEVAKVVNASSIPDMRNAVNSLVVGVHNFVIDRVLAEKNFKMFRDSIEYGGAIQRVMDTDFFEAQESHLLNLQNGVSYLDGKFYGTTPSSALVEDTKTFKVVHSVADDFYSTWWTKPEELRRWMSTVAIKERNTIVNELNQLKKRVINKAIVECLKGDNPRDIKLLTLFNEMEGRTGTDTPTLTNDSKWTLSELKKYRDEWAYFGSFCKGIIDRLVDFIKEPQKGIYNDGSVMTWVSSTEDIGMILLSQFESDIKYLGTVAELHPLDFSLEYQTVETWQNRGRALLPDYSITGTIEVVDGESTSMYGNIVGFIYDIAGVGITNVLPEGGKVTVEPVGAEGFTNLHNHQAHKYFVDTRMSAVAITLD